MGDDQTSCLVAIAQVVTEGHSWLPQISKPNERAEKASIRTTNSKRFKNQNALNDLKFLWQQEKD